ncbi:hypothetical protein [Comamonas sp.]|nr:hypothetical protein [Comamonas sp.]
MAQPSQPRPQQNSTSQTEQFVGPPHAELVSFTDLKKMSVIGIENFKPFRVYAFINALDLGTDGICEQLRYDGYCADGVPRIYLELKLDSMAKRSQLYDLRGKRGAAICATVVSTPRNVNGNLNLFDFTPGPCN